MNDRDLLADASDRDRRDALLLQKYLDGELSEVEHAEFEQRLEADQEHRALLVSICLQKALVARTFNEEHEPLEERSALSDQPSATPGEHATPRTKSWLDRASRHPQGPAFVVAATVLVAALVVLGLVPVKNWMAGRGKNPEGRQPEAPTPSEFVAILNSSHEAKWLDGTQPRLRDPRLAIGRRLAIASGLIEVNYYSGVRVVIEGPAEFVVGRKDEGGRMKDESSEGHPSSFILQPSNAGFLRFGSLVARVEGEKAQGFYVDTPFARIEDHGTEFGIEVQRNGAADVVVLDGKVDLICEAIGNTPRRRVRLVANQGASVAAKGGNIVQHATVDASMVKAMRRRLLATVRHEVKVLPTPTIVSVSSVFVEPKEEDRFRPENLFDDQLDGPGSDYAGQGVGPHTLVLDLGEVFELRGVRFAHRQDAGDWRIDRVHKLELEFAESDTFEEASRATIVAESETLGIQTHSLAALRGRFVRVTFHGGGESPGNVGASVLEFLGSSPPKILEPSADTTGAETAKKQQATLEEDKSPETK